MDKQTEASATEAFLAGEWVDPKKALKEDPYIFVIGKLWVALNLFHKKRTHPKVLFRRTS